MTNDNNSGGICRPGAGITAQGYIDIITGRAHGGADAAPSPAPDPSDLSFEEKLSLTQRYRKVIDATAAVMWTVNNTQGRYCEDCTHRLTERFHIATKLPEWLTSGYHFHKRDTALAAAIEALPPGNEKSLATAFKKAAIYAYCLQGASRALSTKMRNALIEKAAGTINEPLSGVDNIQLDFAAKTGPFAACGILSARLATLKEHLEDQLLLKTQELRTSSNRTPADGASPAAAVIKSPDPAKLNL